MRRLRGSALSGSLFLALALLASPDEVHCAGVSHCDPDLRPPKNDPYAYQLRGDRCEGIYIRDVAGTTLDVVSLTESVEEFSPAAGSDLLIEWSSAPNVALHLRAHALRPRLYYQMDTLRPAGSASYSWPADLLRELKLMRNEIGVLGWSSRMIGGTERTIYFPLRVSQQKPVLRSPSYKLVLLPGVELDEVFISLAPVGEDGHPGVFIVDDKSLERGYYPADKPVAIDLPPLRIPGLYYLEIGAKLRTGGSSAARIWFYSGGA